MAVTRPSLTLYATEQYLCLQGHNDALNFTYGSGKISDESVKSSVVQRGTSISVYGLLGIVDLVSSKYLILINRSSKVAEIQGQSVHKIDSVIIIPLNSQSAAGEMIENERHIQQKAVGSSSSTGTESILETDESDYVADEDQHDQHDKHSIANADVDRTKPAVSAVSNISQSAKRYGAFAQKWIAGATSSSKSSSSEDLQRHAVPHVAAGHRESVEEKEASSEDLTGSNTTPARKSTIDSYTRRILRNIKLWYSNGNFYFSQGYNLSLQLSSMAAEDNKTPLYAQFGANYFWNRHLLQPLFDAGSHNFIMPVMQGFVGQRAFDIRDGKETRNDLTNREHKLVVTLISRRSVKRAGLRYLRRGIDEDGNVANCVETEQILSHVDWSSTEKCFSLVQMRGSIPLYFSQSPYSFKPQVQQHGTEATNRAAFSKHFAALQERYGDVQVASLVDKHGTEAIIGQAYEDTAKWLNQSDAKKRQIAFEWFDFHSVCKGMHFENVSLLINTLKPYLVRCGWTIQQKGHALQTQSGVVRTNCMDCLDRTNVTQSALGGWVLQQQLSELGLNIDIRTDANSIWFNQLWADNGDAISRQYAGTAALKGDFTRTRRRNWTGALSDFSLTLNRYYNNIFGDYFLQTCIDYILGNIGPSAFDDFEANMTIQDHAFDVHRVRQNAIDVCIKIVLEDPQETLIGGWTLSCPHQPNTVRTLPFEECVLLLTGTALYFCRFDWSSEKVGAYERINLADIVEIWRGPYVTSILGSTESDELRNVGFAVKYDTKGTAIVRSNTRTTHTERSAADQNAGKNELEKQAEPSKSQRRFLAFKMLHSSAFVSKTGGHDNDENEDETARKISGAIADAMITAIRKDQGVDHLSLEEVPKVEEKPIIALADAKKTTGYLESVGYSLKKLIY